MLASSLIFPSLPGIIERFVELAPRLFFHMRVTLLEMTLGMLVAAACAFPLAFLMARFRFLRATLQPVFIMMKCLPMFALAPVLILFFGFSLINIVIPTALMILFPLTINIYRGLTATKQSYIDYFRIHGASEMQILLKLKLRFALPSIFSGFRIGAGIAAMSAIAGEWAGAQNGLGIFLHQMRFQFDLEGVFATLLVLLILSLFFYGSFILLEKGVIRKRWKYEA